MLTVTKKYAIKIASTVEALLIITNILLSFLGKKITLMIYVALAVYTLHMLFDIYSHVKKRGSQKHFISMLSNYVIILLWLSAIMLSNRSISDALLYMVVIISIAKVVLRITIYIKNKSG